MSQLFLCQSSVDGWPIRSEVPVFCFCNPEPPSLCFVLLKLIPIHIIHRHITAVAIFDPPAGINIFPPFKKRLKEFDLVIG